MRPSARCLAASVLTAVWLIGFVGSTAWGQVQAQFQLVPNEAEADVQGRVHLVPDRTATRGIQRAQERIAGGEFTQAMRYLDEILGRDEDAFVNLADNGGIRGLKETARELIRDLPTEGRQAYEAAYGPVAQRLLRAAVETGDRAALERISQRYFYTPAGYEAALLCAAEEADAGRHLGAALIYQQLLETPEATRLFEPQLSVLAAASWLAAGEPDKARVVLDALAAGGEQTVRIAGRDHRLRADGDALEWLRSTVGEPVVLNADQQQQWLTYRGNVSRNAVASGGLPHMRVRWNVELLGPLGPPKLESLFENLAADLEQSGGVVPVASSPLAAGDYILTRTLEGLLAIDFRTGKRVWRSEPQRDQQLEALLQSGSSPEEQAAQPELAQSFARRIWEDYLYGLLSSDGSRAYLIRDLAMPASHQAEAARWMGGIPIEESRSTNRLSAYELATQGKLVWEIDGATAAGELQGAFFLGAPVAVGSSLYALVEITGAGVYLAALDAATGQLQWRQQLAVLETGVTLDMRRRLQASMPSYDAGILVCPTGAGVVVGVDLAKRSLAWAYRYETLPLPNNNYRVRVDRAGRNSASRWLDNATTIVGDRVLLTPPESPHLHCVDLRTGRALWRRDRDQMQRLACVHDGRVLLVGNRKALALRLEDGKPAWNAKSLIFPRGAAPSGSGFLSEGKYYLPLTSAEVIAIDVAAGRIVGRAVSRDGAPLGNLICHEGSIISQTGRSLDCFDQIDALRARSEARLAKNADDVEALRTLGEVAYNEGRLSEAIDMLQRAYGLAADDLATREVLAECLASALDEDFASYRGRLPLLKELDDGGPTRRMQILRIESQGLLASGEPLAAAEACFQLYQLGVPAEEMIEIRRDHEAAVSRWAQMQLTAAWQQAKPNEREQLDERIRTEVAALGDAPDQQELARLLDFFGTLPTLDVSRMLRAKQLDDAGQRLESQQILLDLAASADQAMSGEAVARLAQQLHAADLHSLAADFDRQLAGELANVTCLDGATGAELAARWAKAAGARIAPWPQGKVDVRNVPASGAAAASRVRAPMWGIRLDHCDAVLGSTTGQLSSRNGELLLQDGRGVEFFRAGLEAEGRFPYGRSGSVYGASRGNLLVISLGQQLAAFNSLPEIDGVASPMMWRANLGSQLEYNNVDPFYPEHTGSSATRPGSFRAPRTIGDGNKWIGVIGPITSQGCVFQDQRRLVCVDPITGEERWARSDAPAGCDLFGDEEFVFAVPVGSTTAKIYSAVDGRALRETTVPLWRDQLMTLGRNVIQWKRLGGDRMELASIDARSGDVLWRRQYESEACVDVDQGRYVAVVEPKGRVEIIDAQTGATLVDQPIAAEAVVDELHFTVGQDEFLVVVKNPRSGNVKRSVQAFNMADSPVIDGSVYLFDRDSGAMRWNRPAEVIQQALLLTQPADVPFIVFAGTLSRAQNRSRAAATMLVLDKATGRTLYQTDELPQVGVGQCLVNVPDPSKPEATIEMPGCTILLQFTDARRPPEPPTMAEVESGAEKSSAGLMGILKSLGQ